MKLYKRLTLGFLALGSMIALPSCVDTYAYSDDYYSDGYTTSPTVIYTSRTYHPGFYRYSDGLYYNPSYYRHNNGRMVRYYDNDRRGHSHSRSSSHRDHNDRRKGDDRRRDDDRRKHYDQRNDDRRRQESQRRGSVERTKDRSDSRRGSVDRTKDRSDSRPESRRLENHRPSPTRETPWRSRL